MILDFLAEKLAGGPLRIGEVIARPDFSISHWMDEGRGDLVEHRCADDAARIARFDEKGAFRPLKTAPNLRRGWLLNLDSLSEMRVAIDLLYPAAIGNALARERGNLPLSSLRETLGRQTGMYAITKKISDEDALECVRTTCDPVSGCLNQILWDIGPGMPTPFGVNGQRPPGVLPLYCTGACPILIGAARAAVKARQKAASPS